MTSTAKGRSQAPLDALDDTTYQHIDAPPFIPANFGAAAKWREALVLHLLSLMNAKGRTLVRPDLQSPSLCSIPISQTEWHKLIGSAGLEVQKVVALRADVSIIECGLPQVPDSRL